MTKTAERLFNLPESQDDRNFEQQLSDLGLTVEKTGKANTAKAVSGWLKPYGISSRIKTRQLVITKSYISISEDIIKHLAGDPVRVLLRILEYRGGKAILICGSANGFTIHKHNSAYKLTIPPRLQEALNDYQVKRGKYKVEQLKKDGQFMAVFDGS